MPEAQNGRAGNDLSDHLSKPFILQTGKQDRTETEMGLRFTYSHTRAQNSPFLTTIYYDDFLSSAMMSLCERVHTAHPKAAHTMLGVRVADPRVHVLRRPCSAQSLSTSASRKLLPHLL